MPFHKVRDVVPLPGMKLVVESADGEKVPTPFDGLMSLSDDTELWGLSESTLRKALSYGKIVPGIDARKYGKQWVVTREAMDREYGEPVGK